MTISDLMLRDLDGVTMLYQRKLCSLGVVKLKLERSALAMRLDRPHWVEPLETLARATGELEERKASRLEGMEMMDRIRAFVKSPLELPPPPLALVPDEEPVSPNPPADPIPEVPDDATEPAIPRLPPRTL